MRHLLAATCLTPVLIAGLAGAARAEVVISTAVTTNVRTSTAAAGGDDVRVSSTGSVRPTSGVAVTIDSNDNVTNEGTIGFTGVNDATGIFATPGFTGNITNAATGKITIDENYTPTDTDNDGDIDGPFAQGSNRFAIRVGPGGTFTGNIVNAGAITVEGNTSGGIALDGRLAGSLTNSGTIDVIGNNSFGIRAGEITGNVSVRGAMQVRGENSVGAAFDGDIGGALVIQGAIAVTGYRYTTPPADTSKLDADDLLQGGSAIRVTGNVAGGILFDAPPPNNSPTDDDEDDDGIPDAQEGTALVRSFGAAPAVQVGAADHAITIGAVAGAANNGHGIVIRGTIAGDGLYSGVAGNGFVIGGLGGDVTVAGGLTIASATSGIGAAATNANAIALRIGDGASVPEIRSAGVIQALGGGTATTGAVAIQIDQGATVSTIRNSGRIEAAVRGTAGTATAILDRTGGLTLIENSGSILAAGAAGAPASAIDVSANTSGVTIRQTAPTTGTSQIAGNVLFGSGDNVFEVAGGTVLGNTSFGAGDDRLTLSGSANYTGNVDFGGGADILSLSGTSVFNGRLINSAGVAASVGSGSLLVTNTGSVALSSLSVGDGSLGVVIDPTAGAHTRYDVAGLASFGTGSDVVVTITRTVGAEGNFVIVDAGTLTGANNLGLNSSVLPFLYVGSLSASEANGEITLNIRRRNAAELGLNASETSAYDAAYTALAADVAVERTFLGVTDADAFRSSLQQMLPNHAGGTFEAVTQASRATARFLHDPRPPVLQSGNMGLILQQVAWGTSKDLGDTSAYDVDGWGASGGLELRTGTAGALGVTLSYLLGRDRDGSTDNEVTSSQYELGAYWRVRSGPLGGYVRGSAARINFSSSRVFTGMGAGGAFTREIDGDWSGTLVSAGGGVSYEIRSGRLAIRPTASIDYYRLNEDDYAETGGGEALDLSVDSRSSDELAANASLVIGYDLRSGAGEEGTFFRFEAEAGRREILGGTLGATTARFANGNDFTLTPEERTSGFLGRLRLIGGSSRFRIAGEVGAEEQLGKAAVSGRITLHTAF